jgi:5-methyltetrahydrofolate--homocysteine methyltransferase
MLVGAGFNVVDIGIDQPLSAFAETAERENADLVGLSAVMTTTVPVQREVIEYFEALGIRGRHKIIVGGGACTREHAERIGADAYAADAVAAVKAAKRLMGLRVEGTE